MAEFETYRLLFSEDRLSGQYAQDPAKVRKLVNLIPSRAGDLKRKAYSPPFANVSPTIGGSPAWFSFAREFDFYVSGVKTQQIIYKVTNNVSTYLYKSNGAGGITALPAGAYDPPHNAGNGWIGDPILVYSEGLLFISDGDTSSVNPNPNANGNWTVYDGTNTWKMGYDVPDAPTVSDLGSGTSTPGSVGVNLFAEYVVTEFDNVRKHESPPSARVRFTPADPGTYDIELNMPAGGAKNAYAGTGSDWTAGEPTHWRIYRSHVDGSTRLYRVGEIPIASTTFVDTVPMWGETAVTAMDPLDPPYRNHKPKPSKVAAMMFGRMAMRDPERYDRIWVTGFSEVISQDSASTHPIETVPGVRNADVSLVNQSDYENFVDLPDSSFEIRSLTWWKEGLMMATEHSVQFMWGSRPEEFVVANTATYSFGLFSRNGILPTTHGLVMFTDDRKLVIDPSTRPGGSDRTSYVIDIGWDQQDRFDEVDQSIESRFQMVHFNYGVERDWLVVCYTGQDGIAHLLVYDFDTGAWMTFDDVAATCVGVITETQGYKFLVGGNSGTDRYLRVLSDYAGAGTPYAAAATRVGLPAAGTVTEPACILRTGLLDMGDPSNWKTWHKLSYYRKGTFDVVTDVWFDTEDVDAPGTADVDLTLDPQLSSNEFQGWIWRYAKRAQFEFTIAAGGGAGALSGIEIKYLPKAKTAR